MARYNKTRKLRGGQVVSSPGVSPRSEAAVQTLIMSLMRNQTVTSLVPKAQSTLVGIVNNSSIVSPILNVVSPFLINSLISVLKDPGVKAALTTALANIK